MNYNRPWHRLNVSIENAVRKDFDFKEFYNKSSFAEQPGGIWKFNNQTIHDLFTTQWLTYMTELGLEVGSCTVFYRTPHYVHPQAHVDTFRDFSPTLYGLNFTLDANDDSDMVWYDPPQDVGEFTLAGGIETKLYDMQLIQDYELSRVCIGSQLTLVNVTYPHNIIVRERERWSISVRLTPEANVGINSWADAVDKYQRFILN